MIDKERATQIAQQAIATLQTEGEYKFVLQEDKTRETSFGWVFFYNTDKFLQTHENKYRAIGNAPIIVDRQDGSFHFTGTARRIDYYIAEYERKRSTDAGSAKK